MRARQMEDAVLSMAVTARESGQVETARRLYMRLLDVDPESVRARMGLGNIALQERDTAAAARWYLAAVTRAEEPALKHAALLAHGRAALADGQLEAAGESFARLTEPEENAPRSNVAWGHNGVGLTLLLRGDLHGAVASLERAVLLAPEEDRFEGNLDRALAMLGEYAPPERLVPRENSWEQGDGPRTPLAGSDVALGPSDAVDEHGAETAEEQPGNGDEEGQLTPDGATEDLSAESSPWIGEAAGQDAESPVRTEESETATKPSLADTAPVEAEVASRPPDTMIEAIAGEMHDNVGAGEADDSEGYIVTEPADETEDLDVGPVAGKTTGSEGDFALDAVADGALVDESEVRPDSGETGAVATTGERLTEGLPAATEPFPSDGGRVDSIDATSSRSAVLVITENNLPYLQLGAYALRSNAEAAAGRLRSVTDWPVELTDTRDAGGAPLHRVRAGPILRSEAVLELIAELDTLGYRIANPPPESAHEGVPDAVPYGGLETWMVEEGGEHYLQAGAYRDRSAAETLAVELRALTERPVLVREVVGKEGAPLHRVRIGPLIADDPLFELLKPSE